MLLNSDGAKELRLQARTHVRMNSRMRARINMLHYPHCDIVLFVCSSFAVVYLLSLPCVTVECDTGSLAMCSNKLLVH